MVLDAAMMRHEVLNFHPLINTMTTSIAARDLVTFIKATGHEPRILRGPRGEASASAAQAH